MKFSVSRVRRASSWRQVLPMLMLVAFALQSYVTQTHIHFAGHVVTGGFTFPNDRRIGPITIPVPLVRIDYIWTRGPVVPVATHVNCDDGGSDHCMVVADLRVVN